MKKNLVRLRKLSLLLILLFFVVLLSVRPLIASYSDEIRESAKLSFQESFPDSELEFDSFSLHYLPTPHLRCGNIQIKKRDPEGGSVGFQSLSAKEARLLISPFKSVLSGFQSIWSISFLEPRLKIKTEASTEQNNEQALNSIIRSSLKGFEVKDLLTDLFETRLRIASISIEQGALEIKPSGSDDSILLSEFTLSAALSISKEQILLKDVLFSSELIFEERREHLTLSSSLTLVRDQNDLALEFTGGLSTKSKSDDISYFITPIKVIASLLMLGQRVVPQQVKLSLSGLAKRGDDSFNWRISDALIEIVSKNENLGLADSSLKFEAGIVRNPGSKNELVVSPIVASAHLREDKKSLLLLLDSMSASGRDTTIALSDASFRLFKHRIIDLVQASLHFGSERLTIVKESIESGNRSYRVTGSKIDLQGLGVFLSAIGLVDIPGNTSGRAMINTIVKQDAAGRFGFNGKTAVSNLQVPSIQLKSDLVDLSLKDYVFPDSSAKQLTDFSVGLRVKEFELIAPNKDRYNVASLEGGLTGSHLGYQTVKAKGSFKVDGFGFKDKNVTIKDVRSDLKNFSLDIRKDSRIEMKGEVDGDKILLETKGFAIKSVKRVFGPVSVMIGAVQGYVVEGVGRASGGEMEAWGQSLKGVEGTVDFIISKPTMRFRSSRLLGNYAGEPFSLLDGDFSIDDKQFLLRPSSLAAFGGQVDLDGWWGRDDSDSELRLSIKEAEASRLVNLLEPKMRPALRGTISKLTANLKADNLKLLKTVRGKGNLLFKEGVFEELALDAKLKDSVESAFEVKSGQEAKSKKTIVESLALDFAVDDGVVVSDSIELAGRFYTFKGAGKYSFDDGFNVPGVAIFAEKTIGGMGGPVKMLRELLGSLGRVEIPVRIKGRIENVSIETVPSRFLTTLAPGRVVQKVGKGVGELFDSLKDAVTGEKRRNPEPPAKSSQ